MNYFFILSVIITTSICNASIIFKADQLDGVQMKVTDAKECFETDPDACCFADTVELKINADETQINSLTFSGEQKGTNCSGSLTLYPSKYQQPSNEILKGYFKLADEVRLTTYSFFIQEKELSSTLGLFIFTIRTISTKYTLDQYLSIEMNTYKDENGIIRLSESQNSSSISLIFQYTLFILVNYLIQFI